MKLLADRYEVLETVRRTDRGTVLRARDTLDGLPVALKVRPCPDDATLRDLAREASVLLRVPPHPGLPVVRTELRLIAECEYVVVMDWINGTDLDRILAERPEHRLQPAEVVSIIVQTAAVLDHLHQQDPPVLHGDVKPSNLMVTVDGCVVLIDFDIASTGLFRETAGSRFFAAPEVALGGSVTLAIDVYGLAATGMKLLTGEDVGDGRLDLAALEPGAQAIATVLRTALSISADRRPKSAGQLAARVKSCSSGHTVS